MQCSSVQSNVSGLGLELELSWGSPQLGYNSSSMECVKKASLPRLACLLAFGDFSAHSRHKAFFGTVTATHTRIYIELHPCVS